MWDLLGAVADVFSVAPFGFSLFLVGAFAGWMLYGAPGAVIGLLLGLSIGLWLDLSNSRAAKMLRLPLGLAAAGTLLFAFLSGL
jgi:hypothetical protein